MTATSEHLAVLRINLHIPAAQSLKEKRMVIRRIKDRIKNKFNVSISELDGHDKWQVATLGFAMIGNDNRYIDSCLQKILLCVESVYEAEICHHDIEFI